ncbi:MAG: hypothetical protein SXA11_03245 [Cyanobacteriota bacterium]|nr:hypothetical protein [Cyanobacteriota bacterium]
MSQPKLLLPPWRNPNLGRGRIFSHFTNSEGVTGITGIIGDSLDRGQEAFADKLQFGQGSNPFYANSPGDIFVTELGVEATVGDLNLIGVFSDKQKFVVQFSEETALVLNKIRVKPVKISYNVLTSGSSIYTIPGGTAMIGKFLVRRVRL